MHLLLLLDEGVVLGDTAQGELVHQVDLERRVHVLVREVLDRDGEGGGEEHKLAVSRVASEDLLDRLHELDREQLIGFVHNKHGALAQICNVLPRKICNTAWRADENVDRLTKAENIVPQAGPTCCDHDIDVEVFSQRLAHMRSLQCELSSRSEDKALDPGDCRLDSLEAGDKESSGLSCSVLCSG